MSIFAESARQRFEDDMVRHLTSCFNALASELASRDLRKRVKETIAHAAGYRLIRSPDVCRFINLAAIYGWEFDNAPNLAWVREILNDDSLPDPAQRLDRLVQACLHRQSVDENNYMMQRKLRMLVDEHHSTATIASCVHGPEVNDGDTEFTRQGVSVSGTIAPNDSDRLSKFGSRQMQLTKAERSASQQTSELDVGVISMPCPYNASGEVKAIEVQIVGEDGIGLDGLRLQVTRQGETANGLSGKSGTSGRHRFEDLEPGAYWVSLPDLDHDAWRVELIEALPASAAFSAGKAIWQRLSNQALDTSQGITHVVKQGECLAQIADQYGLSPTTIWDHADNADLRERRHDQMYVLLKNDRIVIPAKRQKSEMVNTGNRITLKRLGVPEMLCVRFLEWDGTPRAGVSYLFSVVMLAGPPIAQIFGVTDQSGFVKQSIPPSASSASVAFAPPFADEVHCFNLGHMDPIDTESGWQSRLDNLGYSCGKYRVGGNDPEILHAAIQSFQRDFKLVVTGEMDRDTIAILLEAHQS